MHNILIIGAGLSSFPLIQYVLGEGAKKGWFVTVADADPEKARTKIGNASNGRAVWLDVSKSNDRKDLISRSDIVISLLPAHLHLEVAHDCIKLKKRLLTSSYISHEMYRLGDEARDRELMFTGEMGLDPGLDHMSVMQDIHEIQEKGGEITSFRSYTGALLAESQRNSNPWGYKFTWNPRNVVLAGQGMGQFLVNNKLEYTTYSNLFKPHKGVDIPGLGSFEAYANRDSLLFRDIYGLKNVPNIFRGTLRENGFCEAWDALIQLGLTDGDFPILHSGKISYYELIDAIVRNHQGNTLKERVAQYLGIESDSAVIKKLQWLGLFSKKKIKLPSATPALILEHLLKDKWKFESKDRDRTIIHHEYDYKIGKKLMRRYSTMETTGEDQFQTAMAKIVGLPVAILLKLIMQGNVQATGVGIPVQKSIYTPILEELKEYGIEFKKVDESV